MNVSGNVLNIETISSGMKYMLQISFKDLGLIDYQIEMINNNAKNSLISMERYSFNDEIQLNYDITELEVLKEYLSRNTVNKEIILKILLNICDVILESDNYFLSSSNYVMKIDNVYIDENSHKIKLIYLPIEESLVEDINYEVKKLIKSIIVDYAIIEDVVSDNYVQVILNSIKKSDLNINEFRNIIKELEKNSQPIINSQTNNIQQVRPQQPQVIAQQVNITPRTIEQNQTVNQIQPNNIQQNPKPRVQTNTRSVGSVQTQQGGGVQAPVNIAQKQASNSYNTNIKGNNVEDKKEEEFEIKEVYKTSRKIIAIVIQPIFIVLIISVFLFVKDMELVEKAVGCGLIAIFDVLMLRVLFDKDKKIKVKVKVNNQVNKKVANKSKNETKKSNKKTKNKKGNQMTMPIESSNIAETDAPSVNLAKREIVSQLTYDTEVLDSNMPYLLLSNGGVAEKVFINKEIFKIGRMPNASDYVLANKAVGKVHAQIFLSGQGYYLQDLESINGTFLNGQRLTPNGQCPLQDNDKISLANINMTFKLL